MKVKLPKVPASFAVDAATVLGPGILLCGPGHLVDISPIVTGALLAVSPEVTVPTTCAEVIRPSALSAVTFFNGRDGLGVWSRNTHCGNRLVSTKDAGESWKVIGGELPALGSEFFSPMIFPTPRVGWVLGDGALFTTRDGGQTWSRVRLGGWVAAISASGLSLWAFVSPCNPAVNLCNYLPLIHRKIGRSGGQDRPSIREKCLPVRENGGCETNPCPLRKALFRCAHLRTARTGFR
jgi:hypothetical protein